MRTHAAWAIWLVIVMATPFAAAQDGKRIDPARRTQIETAFLDALKRANPSYSGKPDLTVDDSGSIVGLQIRDASSISDLSPLKGLALRTLRLERCEAIGDFSVLRELPLTSVSLGGAAIADLSMLAGKQLTQVHIASKTLTDISALRGMKLTTVGFFCPLLVDISAMQDMPLQTAIFYSSRSLKDISPLKSAKLRHINFEGTAIRDLSPLRGQPIEEARICCPVLDLSPLEGMPLKHVDVGGGTGNDRNLKDISPLRGMTAMRDLRFDQTSVSDIAVVKDMKSLKFLAMFDTKVKDLSPIKDLQLEALFFTPGDFPPEQLQMVRQMTSLKTIETNWRSWPKPQSAEAFWKRYDAGEYSTR